MSDKRRSLVIGGVYEHFKRNFTLDESNNTGRYKVLSLAEHTESGETLVIYQALYAPYTVFARPYDMFMSEVDKEKYPNVICTYRFTLVYPYNRE